MVKIEELLKIDEKVIKQQGGVMTGRGMAPTGDLFLTNLRLIFLHKKRWALIPFTGTLTGEDLQIPLQNIKSVKKSWGALKVLADKEYTFVVSALKTSGWIESIKQTMHTKVQPPPITQQQALQKSVSKEEIQTIKEKEIIRSKEVIVKIRCSYCKTLYNETMGECPNCGAKI